MRAVAATVLMALSIATAAIAVEPDEVLADPALEARAREISRQLRCVVCQSQSIDDSNAPLAKDMRIVVRERIDAGDSDDEVLEFLAARYGDYVLLTPRVNGQTIYLWIAPLMIFASAAGFASYYLYTMKKRALKQAAPAADDEAAQDHETA